MKIELNSQKQLRFLDATGFLYILQLFRSYRFPKDIVEVYSLNKFQRKAERYYCNKFHTLSHKTIEDCHPLDQYVIGSGFKTVEEWLSYINNEKPNAHLDDLWGIYLVVDKDWLKK